MTPEDQQELDRLCLAVISEKNSSKLSPCVAALNAFLEAHNTKPASSESATQCEGTTGVLRALKSGMQRARSS